MALLLASFVAGCGGSSSSPPPQRAGAVPAVLPDLRFFVLDGATAELRTLDGNTLSETGISAPIDLGAAGAQAGGVALDPIRNRLWIARRDTDEVRIFGAADLGPIATVTAGDQPSAVWIDAESARAYIANEADGTISIFDSESPFAEVAGSPIAVGAAPVDVAVTGGSVVVANRDDATISVLDATTLVPIAGSPFAVGAAPVDLEPDPSSNLLFVVCRDAGSIAVFDEAAATVSTPITGLAQPQQASRGARRDLLYVAEGGGNLRVYTSAALPVEQADSPVVIGGQPAGVAANSFLDRVLISEAATGRVHIHDAAAPFDEPAPGNRPRLGSAPGRQFAVEPLLVRSLISPVGGSVLGSFEQAGRIFIAHGTTGLAILNGSNPRASYADALLATLLVPESAIAVVVDDEYAFISNGAPGVQVADIDDPTAPVVVRTVGGIGTTDELFLFNRFIIVDSGAAGLRVLDVGNPTQAESIATLNPFGGGVGFEFSDEHLFAYSASGGTDLHVIDLSNPALPLKVETMSIPVDCEDVAALPDRVVAVAAGAGGVRFVQVAPASGSIELGQIDLGTATKRVEAFFDLALVTDANNDLHVVVARNPEHPALGGFLDLSAEPREIRLVGNQLYIASGSAGLLIYRFLP